MADPVTLAVVGATAGAVLNKNDPIKGAVIGGTLGYGGGALAGSGAAYGAVPGVGGQQAAMLAAQTGEFGLPGLLATGASGATAAGVNPATAALFNFGANATLSGGSVSPAQGLIASQMLARNQQAQQRLPGAPAIQSRPYTGMKLPVNAQEEEMKRRMMFAMPQVQPIRLI